MTIFMWNCELEVKDTWCGTLEWNVQREGGPDLKEFKIAVPAQSEDKLFFRPRKEPNSLVVVQIDKRRMLHIQAL
jgi:hypothetical protein